MLAVSEICCAQSAAAAKTGSTASRQTHLATRTGMHIKLLRRSFRLTPFMRGDRQKCSCGGTNRLGLLAVFCEQVAQSDWLGLGFEPIRPAADCNVNGPRDLADSRVTQVAQPLPRLRKTCFPDHRNVFGSYTRLFEPGLGRREVHVSRHIFVSGGGQGRNQYGVGFFVPVSLVNRDDDHRAFALLRRIGGKLDKPDLPTQRWSLGFAHRLPFGSDLVLGKLSPQPILLSFLGAQGIVVAGNRGIGPLAFALLLPLPDYLLEDCRRRGATSFFPSGFQVANGLPRESERLTLLSCRRRACHTFFCAPKCALRCMITNHTMDPMPRVSSLAQEP